MNGYTGPEATSNWSQMSEKHTTSLRPLTDAFPEQGGHFYI